MGEWLVVYGGFHLNPDRFEAMTNRDKNFQVANFLEFYHPVQDVWRVEHPFGSQCKVEAAKPGKKRGRPRTKIVRGRIEEELFMARGKFHSVSHRGIYVHNVEEKSWTPLVSLMPLFFPVVGLVESVVGCPWGFSTRVLAAVETRVVAGLQAMVATHDEILCVVYRNNKDGTTQDFFIQSRGFRDGNKEIMWEAVELSISWDSLDSNVFSIAL
ncbi:unnamed protein product [Calypogeia fissa]